MTWTPTKISLLKLCLFVPALAYLGLDLLVIEGPVWHFIHADVAEQRLHSPLVAEVRGEGISRAQLDRYVAEQELLCGYREPREARRSLYLMDMVRQTMLRTRTRYNDKHLPSMRDEAEAEVARLASRYADAAAFEQALASQGYTRAAFTDKVEARLRQFALLERSISPYVEPTEEDIAAAYDEMKDELALPSQREVAHIFLATLNKDAAAVRTQAEQLLAKLQSGEADFATLARRASEDARSAPQGGSLGKLAEGHTPLPELPLFGEKAISAGTPTLAQSRWGWHILLAGDIEPAHTPSLEECRASLTTALRSARREVALRSYLNNDVQDARKRKRLNFFNN